MICGCDAIKIIGIFNMNKIFIYNYNTYAQLNAISYDLCVHIVISFDIIEVELRDE